MSNIVVACTGTSIDRDYLRAAKDQARVIDHDAVVLVHYLYAPGALDDDAAATKKQRLTASSRASLESTAADVLGSERPYRVRVVSGVHERPGQTLVEAIAEQDPALLVMGRRQRSRVGKLMLGSTAQDLLLGVDCAVLALRIPA